MTLQIASSVIGGRAGSYCPPAVNFDVTNVGPDQTVVNFALPGGDSYQATLQVASYASTIKLTD